LVITFSIIATKELSKNTATILNKVKRIGESGIILSEPHTIREKIMIQRPKSKFVQPIRLRAKVKRSIKDWSTKK